MLPFIFIQLHTIAFPYTFLRSGKGKACSNKRIDNIIKEFRVDSESEKDAVSARTKCENYCSEHTKCWGCSASCDSHCSWSALVNCDGYENWEGMIEGDVAQKQGNLIHELLPTRDY